jgi:alpha-D-xyloside xylohydrolase
VPWLFDEESVVVMQRFAKLKNRLFPYLFSASHDARDFGWPVMRAMVLEFPDDPACVHLDRQYMLGSSLLVAPVFRQDNVAEYYVPHGRWTHYFSGEVIDGGVWRQEPVDFMQVPLLVRENTVLPMGSEEDKPGWKLNEELTLQLHQIADGADVSVSVAATDNPHRVIFRCQRTGGKFVLTSDGRAKDVKVLLPSHRSIGDLGNGKLRGPAGEVPLVSWTDTAKPLAFSLKD